MAEQKLRSLNHLHKGYWQNFAKGIPNANSRIFLTEVYPTYGTYTIKYAQGHSVTCTIMSNSDEIMSTPVKDAFEGGWNWLRPVILWPQDITPPETLIGHLRVTMKPCEVEPVFESKRTETFQTDTLWLLDVVTKDPLVTVVLDINLKEKTAMTTVTFAENFNIHEYHKCEL